MDPSPSGIASLRTAVGAQSGNGVVSLSWSQAGTGVGDLFAPTTPFNANETVLGDDGSPLGQLPGAPSWTVPDDGVITSWAYQAGPDVPRIVELKVAQPSGGGYQIAGNDSSSGNVPANSISTFSARIPVKAGEEIGAAFAGTSDLLPVAGAGVIATDGNQEAGQPGAAYGAITPGGAPLGFDISVGGPPKQGAALPIEAFVEPDADHDGFGDTTQDRCPGVYGGAQGCPAADLGVSSSGLGGEATAGDTLSDTFTVTDHGPDPVADATLTISPGSTAEVVSATTSTTGGRCATGPTAGCTLGALGEGDSATVRVLLRTTAGGALVDTATVAGPNVPTGIGAGDPNPANDSVSDAVTVTSAPFPAGAGSPAGGATMPGADGSPDAPTSPGRESAGAGGRSASSRFSGARLRGPITAAGRRVTLTVVSPVGVHGTVVLTASAAIGVGRGAHAGIVRVAGGRFAVAAGRPARIRLVLGRATLALLRAHRDGIRVRVTLTSRGDGAGSAGPVTTRATVRLRPANGRRR
jgi:hypothetical protein